MGTYSLRRNGESKQTRTGKPRTSFHESKSEIEKNRQYPSRSIYFTMGILKRQFIYFSLLIVLLFSFGPSAPLAHVDAFISLRTVARTPAFRNEALDRNNVETK